MSIPHAQPGKVFNVRALGDQFAEAKTHTLVKTTECELLRLVLPSGKVIAEHHAPSEITVQCLEGRVAFTTMGETVMLTAGDMLYLPAKEPHALKAEEDSSLLVTLLLKGKDRQGGG